MAQVEKVEDDMSMDEILASIRRIISEESKAEEKNFSAHDEQEKPVVSPATLAQDTVKTQPLEPLPQEKKEETPPPSFIGSVKETLYGFPREGRGEFSSFPPTFGQTPPMPAPMPSSAPQATMQAPVKEAEPAPAPVLPSLGIDQNSQLQAFMYELIRPLLKDWVDAYLPSLIEKAVAAEVSKMFQKLREP